MRTRVEEKRAAAMAILRKAGDCLSDERNCMRKNKKTKECKGMENDLLNDLRYGREKQREEKEIPRKEERCACEETHM